jgi:hypothetical protein
MESAGGEAQPVLPQPPPPPPVQELAGAANDVPARYVARAGNEPKVTVTAPVPVIDLARLCEPGGGADEASKLRLALESWGLFLVRTCFNAYARTHRVSIMLQSTLLYTVDLDWSTYVMDVQHAGDQPRHRGHSHGRHDGRVEGVLQAAAPGEAEAQQHDRRQALPAPRVRERPGGVGGPGPGLVRPPLPLGGASGGQEP